MKKNLLFAFFLTTQTLFAQTYPVALNDTFSVNKNNTVNLPVLSNDFDADGDSLTITLFLPPANGSASLYANQIMYTPHFNFSGGDMLSYIICDATNLCDTAAVYISVLNTNNAPVALSDNYSVAENSSILLPVTSNDFDPDGEALSVSLIVLPAHGTASVVGNLISYMPDSFYFGIDSLVYAICDTGNLCDTATVYIFINGSNSSPVATDDQFTFTDTLRSAFLDVLFNDSDSEGDSLFVSKGIDLDNTNILGSLSVDSVTGRLVFIRNGLSCGTEVFSYIVCDFNSCDTALVSVTINCPSEIFLTEGFSPDGDGINDKLVFTGLEYFAPASLKVFNRYGNIVYTNEDYKNDWDGTYSLNDNHKPLPDGTYFYILHLFNNRSYRNFLVINR